MTDIKTASFPILKVVAFLDQATAVVIGAQSEKLKDGDILYILGEGRSIIPEINLPLVAPKAKVVVTFAAGRYAFVQKPPVRVDESYSTVFRSLLGVQRQIEQQLNLTSTERNMLGDPGRHPVEIGDPVIRESDLAAYIAFRAETESKPAIPPKPKPASSGSDPT